MNKSYVASGDAYGALLDSNKNKISGFVDMGEASPVSIEVKLKQKKQKSARKGMRGQLVDSGATIDEVVGSMGIKSWVAKNIAMLLSGSAVPLSGADGTVTDEAIVLPADGSWVELANKNVSAVVITTLTAGVDYEVKPVLGFIRSMTGAEITNTVAYAYAAQSGYKIEIGSSSVIRMALKIDGQNDEGGAPFVAEFDSVVFIPKGALNIISDPETDYEEMEFDLLFETIPGKTSPGTINGFAV